MENTAQNLIQAGFEPKEAEIYLAILSLGKATVTDIARKSGVKRTTVYEYLDNLVRGNLVHKTSQGKRIMYLAENPEKIGKLLDHRKKHFEKILPDLKSVFARSSHKPQIRFYEGIEGMRAIYEEMTKTSQTIYGTFSADKFYQVFNEKDNQKFFENLKQNGAIIKDLVENTPFGKKYVKSDFYKNNGMPKLLPEGFEVSVDLLVAGDKVSMMSFVNLVGVIIENPEIAELQRNFIKFIRRNIN
jgi:HTH-type transcriptional regulator, sugar sensing transcriptional regulator